MNGKKTYFVLSMVLLIGFAPARRAAGGTSAADLSITKTDGVPTAVPGGSVTYTITAANNGPDPDVGMVSDTFPAAIIGCSTTCVGAAGGTCTPGPIGGNINDLVNLPAGASATYTATCSVAATATGSMANTATISGSADPDPSNDSATDTDLLTPQADLAITKTDGSLNEVPGTPVTYTIVASNNGPSSSVDVLVSDSFPGFLSNCVTTCVGAGGGSCGGPGPIFGDFATEPILPPGGSVTYTSTCDISPSATGSLVNTATVSLNMDDPLPGNNSATDTDFLGPTSDPIPLGPEFPINLSTAGDQVAPRTAVSREGSSVAVWQGPEPGGGQGIFARRFDADGRPVGAEISVNGITAGDQTRPAVAMDPLGRFAVAWEGPDAVGSGIHARLFLANGSPATAEILVNTTTANAQDSPAVAIAETGNLLVTWRSAGQDGSGGGIYGRLYNSDGAPLGAEFRINTSTAGNQADPDVDSTEFPRTAYFVVWEGPDGNSNGVFLQQVSAGGGLVASEILVNGSSVAGSQENPAVAVSSLDPDPGAKNRVTVVWQGPDPATTPANQKRIWSRSFLLSGSPVAAEETIDDDPAAEPQIDPDVTMGDVVVQGAIPFVATWTEVTDPDPASLLGTISIVGAYRPPISVLGNLTGSPANTEFLISSHGDENLNRVSSLASSPQGDFICLWQSFGLETGSSSFGIFGRRFAVPPYSIFRDGFESGDTGAWSQLLP